MDKKIVGKVTEDEKREIQELYEKKLALENLLKIIDSSNEQMYVKLVADYGSTMRLFQEWWNKMHITYNWKSEKDKSWNINFETNEVSLQ